MLIDTHAHLYFDWFDDRDDVIERAYAADVKRIVCIAIDVPSSQQSIDLAGRYPGVFAAVGVHPNDSRKLDENALDELAELCHDSKVVAIGEIGLDFYRDHSPRDIQITAFRKQIRLAKKVGLPIIIHNRDAGHAILEVLRSEDTAGLTGVFHCFSEDERIAHEALEIGFYISFTGNLTFKKSSLPEVARCVPLERLLLETDSPFLSPEPKRGRRNEPAHVKYIAEKLAEIHQTSFARIEEATTANAAKLFGLGVEEMK